jgi:hypothetical protein
MGFNSGDGFWLVVSNGADAFTFPLVAGEFSGGRGAGNWGFTHFPVRGHQQAAASTNVAWKLSSPA